MRQRFETEEDLRKEREAMRKASLKWACSYQKMPEKYYLDFALMREDKITAFCEVRCRNKMYETYMLSLHKFKSASELRDATALPTYLLVDFPEKLMFCDLNMLFPLDLKWGGMNNPRDWQDQEPMVFIPMKEFKEL